MARKLPAAAAAAVPVNGSAVGPFERPDGRLVAFVKKGREERRDRQRDRSKDRETEKETDRERERLHLSASLSMSGRHRSRILFHRKRHGLLSQICLFVLLFVPSPSAKSSVTLSSLPLPESPSLTADCVALWRLVLRRSLELLSTSQPREKAFLSAHEPCDEDTRIPSSGSPVTNARESRDLRTREGCSVSPQLSARRLFFVTAEEAVQ